MKNNQKYFMANFIRDLETFDHNKSQQSKYSVFKLTFWKKQVPLDIFSTVNIMCISHNTNEH